jgi:SnoaL-like domain
MQVKICYQLFKRIILLLISSAIFTACGHSKQNFDSDKSAIAGVLDSFNVAAAKADYNNYFKYLTDDAVFIGTDAHEYWNKKDFMIWAKPYFEKGKAWNFKSMERNIYFDKSGMTAWFDELLNTQMKICRGSGVLTKENNQWKIRQYVLSMTMPNQKINEAIKIKSDIEDSIILKLGKE